ncbi:MAG: endonuclease domain-containing protein [Bacteroidetes bacterium]|nr:endonuclease domain-containing protein [Bacteroidota bacterium]
MKAKKKIGYIEYDKDHKLLSRELRNNSTLGEILLWNQLKAGKMLGHKFNRQKPLGDYIVDFYCKKLNLVIEVDGYSHQFKTKKDLKRDKDLNEMGLSVLRFIEQQCKKDMLNVVRAIETWIEENQNTNPPASLPPL